MRFEIGHQTCGPGESWQHLGSEEGDDAEHALQRLRDRAQLEPGWYRAVGEAGKTDEFFLDGLGLTRIV